MAWDNDLVAACDVLDNMYLLVATELLFTFPNGLG